MNSTPFACVCLALALSACNTTTIAPIDHEHPASLEAAAASTQPLRPMLTADAPTQRTRDLLTKRAAEEKAAGDEAPGDETNIGPTPKQPSGHEHHH